MRIKDLVTEATETAASKGWHNNPVHIPESLCLIHSEVSEALEAHRVGLDTTVLRLQCDCYPEPPHYICGCTTYKPEGLPSELADVVIRVAHLCGRLGIDLEKELRIKMDYNKTRSYRHGGKKV